MSADKVSLLHEVEDLRLTCARQEQTVRTLKENLAVEKVVAEGHYIEVSQDLQEAKKEDTKMRRKLQEAKLEIRRLKKEKRKQGNDDTSNRSNQVG